MRPFERRITALEEAAQKEAAQKEAAQMKIALENGWSGRQPGEPYTNWDHAMGTIADLEQRISEADKRMAIATEALEFLAFGIGADIAVREAAQQALDLMSRIGKQT